MLTVADFQTDYPEFGAIDPVPSNVIAIITRVLNGCDAFLSNSTFGNARDYALGLYVAHKLAVRYKIAPTAQLQNQSNPGIATSVNASTSGLSVTQQAAVASDAPAWKQELARTNYGLQFLAILTAVSGAGQVVGCGGAGIDAEQGITTNAGFPVPSIP